MHTVRRSLAGRAQCRGRFECSLPVFLQRAPHSPRRVEGTRTQDQMWQVAENLHSHTVDGPPSLPTVHKGNKRWPRRVFSASGRHRRKYESVWSGADEAQRVPGSDRRCGLPAICAIVEAQPGIRLVREVRPNLGQGGAPRNLVSVKRVPSTGRGMLRAVPGVLVLPSNARGADAALPRALGPVGKPSRREMGGVREGSAGGGRRLRAVGRSGLARVVGLAATWKSLERLTPSEGRLDPTLRSRARPLRNGVAPSKQRIVLRP